MRPWLAATMLALASVTLTVSGFAADLPFKVLSTGKVNGQVEAGQSEAHDRKALLQLWSRLGLKGAPPKVDFKRRLVVAWVGGGSACDKYVLERVHEESAEVVLDIDRVRPPPGHMCIMIFTPHQLVASIPVTSKRLRFEIPDGSAGADSR